MKLVKPSLLGVACIAALVACKGSSGERDGSEPGGVGDKSGAPSPGERVGVTTVTGADLGTLSNELAVERIVTARCAREAACNNVGSDKHFGTNNACTRELQSTVGADLTPGKCMRGIDVNAIDKCTDAIRTESCNNPVDTLSRLAACRASALCLEAQPKTR